MLELVLGCAGVLSVVANVLVLRAMEARIVAEVKYQKLMVEEHMQWLSRYAAPSIAAKLVPAEKTEKPEKSPAKKRGRPRKSRIILQEPEPEPQNDNDRQLSAAALLEAPTLPNNEIPDLPEMDIYGQNGES